VFSAQEPVICKEHALQGNSAPACKAHYLGPVPTIGVSAVSVSGALGPWLVILVYGCTFEVQYVYKSKGSFHMPNCCMTYSFLRDFAAAFQCDFCSLQVM
jgi:hypothetical protein